MSLKGTRRKEHKAIRSIDLDLSRHEPRRLKTGRPKQDASIFSDGGIQTADRKPLQHSNIIFMAHSVSSLAD
jgi:hypothetical protein